VRDPTRKRARLTAVRSAVRQAFAAFWEQIASLHDACLEFYVAVRDGDPQVVTRRFLLVAFAWADLDEHLDIAEEAASPCLQAALQNHPALSLARARLSRALDVAFQFSSRSSTPLPDLDEIYANLLERLHTKAPDSAAAAPWVSWRTLCAIAERMHWRAPVRPAVGVVMLQPHLRPCCLWARVARRHRWPRHAWGLG
jgi:hypothetical protein